jgi:hypothetical protein
MQKIVPGFLKMKSLARVAILLDKGKDIVFRFIIEYSSIA